MQSALKVDLFLNTLTVESNIAATGCNRGKELTFIPR